VGTRAGTLQRMQGRVDELVEGFGHYVDVFDEKDPFTGPSLYFHFKTLNLLRRHASATQALEDCEFFESMYATLTAWGMHKMGPRGAKLVELPKLIGSFRQQADQIRWVESLCIWEIETQDVPEIARLLWDIISRLQVGVGKTKIVAGSKALHHVLPDLIPPIDREYTIRFFYNRTMLRRDGEREFTEIYPHFHRIGKSCQSEIQSRLGAGMNTSVTKVIDNAIVGYGLKHLKSK
jgi:hypothetical protein